MTVLAALLREVLLGQQEILGELRALRAAVPGPRPRRPAYTEADKALVQAIHAAVGSRRFVAAEIIDYQLAPGMKGAAGICAALRAAIRTPNPISLGKRLERVQDLDLDGFRVKRIDADREGVIWSVVRELRE